MSYPLPPPILIPLTTLPAHDCNYLPGRVATSRAFRIDRMPAEIYHNFMDAGFRRSGQIIYQPTCDACRRCVPIRVLVGQFKPNRSQRRSVARNSDLVISQGIPNLNDEKIDLYRRYLFGWHGRNEQNVAESLETFLYRSPVDTIEFCYRTPAGKLVGVGIADICSRSFSSVYFYFDPDEASRGLGTFSAVYELNWCRSAGIEYYYLGFWINGCDTMQYKSKYSPSQILNFDGEWINFLL